MKYSSKDYWIMDQIVIGDTIFSEEKELKTGEIKYFIRSLAVPEREEIRAELFNITKAGEKEKEEEKKHQ